MYKVVGREQGRISRVWKDWYMESAGIGLGIEKRL